MLKNFFISLVAFLTVFLTNSQGWAAANTVEKVSEVYTVNNNAFSNDSIAFEGTGKRNTNNMLWIASIFLGGLGQILMGDTGRGLKFLLIEAGLVALNIVLGIVLPLLFSVGNPAAALGSLGIVSIIGLVIWVAFIVVRVWGVLDAMEMAGQTSGMSAIDAEKLAKELNTVMEIASNVRIDNNGVALKALAF
jgi:hypothetical protein